jgi:type IV pilus assembly protein PilB
VIAVRTGSPEAAGSTVALKGRPTGESWVSEQELRDLLVTRLELIDEGEFEQARTMAARLRLPLERALADRSRVPFGFLLEQLAHFWGIEFLDLKVSDVQPDALRMIPEDYARAHLLIPFEWKGQELKVAMANPRDDVALSEIRRWMAGYRVTPYLAPETAIRRAHILYRGNIREMLDRAAAETTGVFSQPAAAAAADRSAVDLFNRILEYAVVARASDVHIEPHERETLVRYRIDGVLHEALSLPPAAHPPLITRIKLLSGMRIDERRVPQDGRYEPDLSGFKMDLRVSSVPTQWGEKLALRVLSKETVYVDLEGLGLAPSDYEKLLAALFRPFGMVLVTGPTGCGKSTTLYAMLTRLGLERRGAVNLSTIEDPIEYLMPRVTQISLNPAAGLDFASGLRALLRQDPDVIMVGEIRDRETVEIAVRAALVGRLLLSTLHTNDATGAVPRLLDMGVEPFLLASTLVLVLAQRLVRRICVNCRESLAIDGATLAALQARPDFGRLVSVLRAEGTLGKGDQPLAGIRIFKGKGCSQCNGSGYRGRLGVFELFPIDDPIREMIMRGQDGGTIRAVAIATGMKTMFQDGLAKVLLGETTLEEVFRVAL